jgi:hypothetical protein
MGHVDARPLIGVVNSCALLFWAALSAFADSGLPPQRPTLDPPTITANEPSDTAARARISGLDVSPYSHGEPTPEEQYMLELINRARANPPAEGLRLQTTNDPDILSAYSYFQVDLAEVVTDFAGYLPRPPLAFNANLIASARGHSQDMAVNDFQGHTGSNGSTLTSRIEAAGYTGWNALAENVYAYAKNIFYGHAAFNVDWGVPSLGHRLNIMNFSASGPVYTEIGIGIVAETSPSKGVGPLVVTEDFGTRAGAQRFVVGVIYKDDDRDGFYSIGEGIAGILVSTSQGNYAYTSASGGYAIPLTSSSGSITVRAEGAGLGAAQERPVALAGNNVKADFVAAPSTHLNFEGLWWNSPGGSESGWGINVAHQGNVIFATWFTYDATGKAWWLTMTADKTGENVYSGNLIRTNGAPFSAFIPPAQTTVVGTGALTFTSATTGTLTYAVNDGANVATQTKAIVLQTFGPVPTCVWGAQSDLTKATNFQDLWWAAPAGLESGWGINLTQQGTKIFATWFTYDANRDPLWLSALLTQTGQNTYSGALDRTTGPAFNAVPFDPTLVHHSPSGTAMFRFTDGNTATFDYNVDLGDGVNEAIQSKAITREVFRAPGTVCE